MKKLIAAVMLATLCACAEARVRTKGGMQAAEPVEDPAVATAHAAG